MHKLELIPRIDSFVGSCMGSRRYTHSRSTAELARDLCSRFGVDEDKGYIAGLAHDAARELSAAEVIRLCVGDGNPVSGTEVRDPALLHGRAAAAFLALRTDYHDGETLDAIRDHVTGRPSMGPLSKIVFCADLLEPGRDLPDRTRQKMFSLELDAMTLSVLKSKIRYLRSIRKAVSPLSRALLKELS
jgi:predicted HD superfamily hydrolase involved in NAD metabolism